VAGIYTPGGLIMARGKIMARGTFGTDFRHLKSSQIKFEVIFGKYSLF
jgi:hypothetical protein